MKALTGGVNFYRCEKVTLTDEYSKLICFPSVKAETRFLRLTGENQVSGTFEQCCSFR